MPNIQFHATDELYTAHKKIPDNKKQESNDFLRKVLQKERIKKGYLKS